MSKTVSSRRLLDFLDRSAVKLIGSGYYDFSQKKVVTVHGSTDSLPDYFHYFMSTLPRSTREIYFDLPGKRFLSVHQNLGVESIVLLGLRKKYPVISILLKDWEDSKVKNLTDNEGFTIPAELKPEKSSTLRKKAKTPNSPEKAGKSQPEPSGDEDSDSPDPSELAAISRIQKRIKRKHNLSNLFSKHALQVNMMNQTGGLVLWRKKLGEKIILVTADCHQTGVSGALLSINCHNLLNEYDFSRYSFKAYYKYLNNQVHSSNLNYIGENETPPDITTAVYQIDPANKSLHIDACGDGCMVLRKGKVVLNTADLADEKNEYIEHVEQFDSNDLLLFYTFMLSGKADTFKNLLSDIKKSEDLVSKMNDIREMDYMAPYEKKDYLLGAVMLN